ncbi:hypothetical protein [Neobacillus driksii]|uniref:hypothetical protein n=1 Tax=Neobacillus driksii TaxID=3035913 RepID=UPI0027D8D2C5|nr:hypothetical protein [Neobacillus niacini]
MKSFEKLHPLLKSFVEKGPAGCACAVTYQGKTVLKITLAMPTLKPKNQFYRIPFIEFIQTPKW